MQRWKDLKIMNIWKEQSGEWDYWLLMTKQRHGGGTNLQQGVISLGLRCCKDLKSGSNQTVVWFTWAAPLQEGCDVKASAWTRCIAWLSWCMNVMCYPGKIKKGKKLAEKRHKKLVNIVEVVRCSVLVAVQSCCWDKISDYITHTYRLDYRSVRSNTAQLLVYLEQSLPNSQSKPILFFLCSILIFAGHMFCLFNDKSAEDIPFKQFLRLLSQPEAEPWPGKPRLL